MMKEKVKHFGFGHNLQSRLKVASTVIELSIKFVFKTAARSIDRYASEFRGLEEN